MSGQRRAISSPRGLLQSTARWRLTTRLWPQPCGGAGACNRSLALCEGASVALVGPAARRPRKCSVVLRVASVVCALILVATTPKCAVWVVAVRHAMIRSWSRLGARCVTWAASRESSASVQVVCAGKCSHCAQEVRRPCIRPSMRVWSMWRSSIHARRLLRRRQRCAMGLRPPFCPKREDEAICYATW